LAVVNHAAYADTIAHWRFEPGQFTTDSSGNGHALLNSGATPSVDVAGAGAGSGSALFDTSDGADIMQTAANLDLSPYDYIRISWWQKPLTTNEDILWEHSPDYNANNGGLIGVVNSELIHNPGVGYVGLRGPGMSPGYSADRYTHRTDGTWEHFAVEINLSLPAAASSEVIKIYQNGVEVGSDSLVSTVPTAFRDDTFYLGARSGLAAAYDGLLDEVKIEFIPEPATLSLLIFGGLAVLRRRRRTRLDG